mgnify:CR=1 FL=1
MKNSKSKVYLFQLNTNNEVLVLDRRNFVHGVLDIYDLKDVNKVLADVNEVIMFIEDLANNILEVEVLADEDAAVAIHTRS